MTEIVTEVLSVAVQRELAEKWVWKCSGCGHTLFIMQGSVIQLLCKCKTMNTMTLVR